LPEPEKPIRNTVVLSFMRVLCVEHAGIDRIKRR
jgi:hypothetical protein